MLKLKNKKGYLSFGYILLIILVIALVYLFLKSRGILP